MSEATFEDRDLYVICLLEIQDLEKEILRLQHQDSRSASKRPRKGTVYPRMTGVLAEHIASNKYPDSLVVKILEKVQRGRILQVEHLEVRLHDFRTILDSLDICPVCKGFGYDATTKPHVSEGSNPHIPSCDKCGGRGTKTGIKKQEEWAASIPKCDLSGLGIGEKPSPNPVLDEEIQL
ncbi:MAG: hypothetical protein A2114_01305 [Candidatus Vogelbacteria bacterium GWA1_51_14]|uniref:Uncharacterized protein n=1 Tax=Candidatus Vogelbacteria bacterium GWA1_51_14 TaxID=1802435 RepID=A0A1G2QC14_9BACT|nr:MAG: hypothetical protein A2114_01305 [Candidatus Vogelbacteria bacterium GWA1_51_14]